MGKLTPYGKVGMFAFGRKWDIFWGPKSYRRESKAVIDESKTICRAKRYLCFDERAELLSTREVSTREIWRGDGFVSKGKHIWLRLAGNRLVLVIPTN